MSLEYQTPVEASEQGLRILQEPKKPDLGNARNRPITVDGGEEQQKHGLKDVVAPGYPQYKAQVDKHPAPDHDQKEHGRRGVHTLVRSPDRAWSGPTELKFQFDSQKQLGDYGELVAFNVLDQLGLITDEAYKPTSGLTTTGREKHAPIDLVTEDAVYEIKAGLVSSKEAAWRVAPGRSSKQDTTTRSERTRAAMDRKEQWARAAEERAGTALDRKTVGLILDPDRGLVDVYLVPGFHATKKWGAAREHHVGSFSFDHEAILQDVKGGVEPSLIAAANVLITPTEPVAEDERSGASEGQVQVNSGMLRNELLDLDFTHEHDGFPRHPIRVQDHPAYFQSHRGLERPQPSTPTNPELQDRIARAAGQLKEAGLRVRFNEERGEFRVTGQSAIVGGFIGEWMDWRQLLQYHNVELRARQELEDQTDPDRQDPTDIGESEGDTGLDLGPMHEATWDHVLGPDDVRVLLTLKEAGIKGGVNKTTFMVGFNDGSRGVYKAASDESEVERLTSKFAKEFIDSGLVPEVQAVDLGKGAGHVMKVVDGDIARNFTQEEVLGSPRRVRSFAWMTALDVALGNPDRHKGNVLVDLEGDQLWAIDNGLGFGEGLYHADPLRFDANSLDIPQEYVGVWYRELSALADKWETDLERIDSFFDTNPDVRGKFYDDPPAKYKKSVRWTVYSMRLAVKAWRGRDKVDNDGAGPGTGSPMTGGDVHTDVGGRSRPRKHEETKGTVSLKALVGEDEAEQEAAAAFFG